MKRFAENRVFRIFALVMRMALGAFFIVSAVAKLLDIDMFELYVFSYNILSLKCAILAARLVIVAELWIGLGLLSNVWKRFVDCCTLLMLTGFTLFLGYAALIGRTDSCQCMGSLLEMNPLQSILKNALLLLVLLVAMYAKPWNWKPRWFVWLPVLLAPLVTVFILSAPDNWLFGPSKEVYNKEELQKAIAPSGELAPLNLDEGRHLLAFVTPGCPMCKMADEKLTYICNRNKLDTAEFVYFIPAHDSTIVPLTRDSSSFLYPGYLIRSMTFALITYGQRPIVFLMEDGEVKTTYHYRNIDEEQIVDFLTDED